MKHEVIAQLADRGRQTIAFRGKSDLAGHLGRQYADMRDVGFPDDGERYRQRTSAAAADNGSVDLHDPRRRMTITTWVRPGADSTLS